MDTRTNDDKICPKQLRCLCIHEYICTQYIANKYMHTLSAINALEMSLRIHSDQLLSVSLITDVLRFAASFHSQNSIRVNQILNNKKINLIKNYIFENHY
eukprot:381886_1